MIPAITPVALAGEAIKAAKAAGRAAADFAVRIVPKRWRSARAMRDAATVAKSETVDRANTKSGLN